MKNTKHTAGPWSLARYKNQWAIYDSDSRCYVLFGPKNKLIKRLESLNENK